MSAASTTTPDERLARILANAAAVEPLLLEKALAEQKERGAWLGQILVEKGVLTPTSLIAAIARGAGLQAVDLSSYPIDVEAATVLGEQECRAHMCLAVSRGNGVIFLAMANPFDDEVCDSLASRTGLRVERLVATEREIQQAIERTYAGLERSRHPSASQVCASAAEANEAPELPAVGHIDDLLHLLIQRGGSDLHLGVGSPPTIRVNGELIALPYQPVTPTAMQELIYSVLTDERVIQFEQEWELDFAYSVPGLCRFRVNVHRQRGSIGAVLRAVPMNPPTLEQLRMPPVLKEFCTRPRGLVLVTGPTGSGKSTTLAAMVHEINKKRRCHIVTIEDPIEFLHRNLESIVTQREVGADTKSFSVALRHVLRQDPDVILIGEMRDLETIAVAVTAAETGHLVFATLHTNAASQTIDRIIDVFPPHQQQQIRTQLSTVLEGIICQTLLPSIDGKGRVCAQEILVATPAVRNLIREGKPHQIESVVQSGGQFGMQTLNQALVELVRSRKVAAEVAMAASSDPNELRTLLGMA